MVKVLESGESEMPEFCLAYERDIQKRLAAPKKVNALENHQTLCSSSPSAEELVSSNEINQQNSVQELAVQIPSEPDESKKVRKDATHLTKSKREENCCSPINMQILGGFIAVLGIAAVVIAFTVLSAGVIPVASQEGQRAPIG